MRRTLTLSLLLIAPVIATCGPPPPPGNLCGGSNVTVRNASTLCPGTCSPDPCCAPNEVKVCCTCVALPASPLPLVRTACADVVEASGAFEYCDPTPGRPADLSCLEPAGYPTAPPACSAPMDCSATVHGVVDVFGNGSNSDAITVTFFAEGADGTLGAMLAQTTSSIAACAAAMTAGTWPGPCTDEDPSTGRTTRQLGYYEIVYDPATRTGGIPLDTQLVVRTTGSPTLWHSVYSFNEMLAPPATPTTPITYTPRVLSVDDWATLPPLAGEVGGIGSGRGALAGEVHDCGDVRLSPAVVGVEPRPQILSYFSDNPDQPLPVPGIDTTTRLGLYAAIDERAAPEAAGGSPANVTGLGWTGSEWALLGFYRVRVFADAATSLPLRGLRFFQRPP